MAGLVLFFSLVFVSRKKDVCRRVGRCDNEVFFCWGTVAKGTKETNVKKSFILINQNQPTKCCFQHLNKQDDYKFSSNFLCVGFDINSY